MSIIKLHVTAPYADHILSGAKTVEGRKANEKWLSVKVDDIFVIQTVNPTCESYFRVIRITRYPSLFFFLTHEGLRNVLPGIEIIDAGIQTYVDFDPDYAQAEILAFQLEKVLFHDHDSATQTEEIMPSPLIRCNAIASMLKNHIQGSSNPTGDPNCAHEKKYNDETMGGCGSDWDAVCTKCGLVWY